MILSLAHGGLAQIMSCPEVALSYDETVQYTEAVAEFMRWHITGFKPDGKRGSEIALVICLAMLYVPRAIAIVGRKKAEAARPVN